MACCSSLFTFVWVFFQLGSQMTSTVLLAFLGPFIDFLKQFNSIKQAGGLSLWRGICRKIITSFFKYSHFFYSSFVFVRADSCIEFYPQSLDRLIPNFCLVNSIDWETYFSTNRSLFNKIWYIQLDEYKHMDRKRVQRLILTSIDLHSVLSRECLFTHPKTIVSVD